KSLLPADRAESTTTLKDDSQMYREGKSVKDDAHWLTNNLWTGLVPHYGPVWTTLLGSPREIADALLEYERLGVTEFIISGRPELDTVDTFGREVLPLVQGMATAASNTSAVSEATSAPASPPDVR